MIQRIPTWLGALGGVALLVATGFWSIDKPSDGRLEDGMPAEKTATTETDEEAVATVNGEAITLAEFNRRIQRLEPYARARMSSVDKRKAFLENVVQFEVLADEAERRGYGDDQAAIGAIKEAMVERMLESAVEERVGRDAITDEDVSDYYDAHRAEFTTPAGRHVAVIQVETRGEIDSIRDDLLELADGNASDRVDAFRRGAARYSLAPNAKQDGGEAGWVTTPDASPDRPELARRVYALDETGEITEPFQMDGHWTIATYFESRERKRAPLEDVRRSIEETLLRDKKREARRAVVDEIRSQASIERHDDVLSKVEPPASEPLRSAGAVPTVDPEHDETSNDTHDEGDSP